MTDRASIARTYYRSIDEGDYDALRTILAPAFVHERPDRSIDGSDRFVRFMREERPRTDTTHAVDSIYEDETAVAVRGRLLGDSSTEGDEHLFGFVDVFDFEGEAIERIRTYTR